MNAINQVRAVGVFALVATFVCLSSVSANPNKVFRGEIITAKKRIPTSAKSPRAYVKKLRKLRTKRFKEDDEKKWKIHYAAFFRKPLNDLEVTVKIYDVSDGRRHLKQSFQQYVSERGQRSLVSSVKLERETFGANRRILMTLESRGAVLAMGKFDLLGEREKHSGSVDFTSEE